MQSYLLIVQDLGIWDVLYVQYIEKVFQMQHDENNGRGIESEGQAANEREENKAMEQVEQSRELEQEQQDEHEEPEAEWSEHMVSNQAQVGSQAVNPPPPSSHPQSEEEQGNPSPMEVQAEIKNLRKQSSQSVRQSREIETPQVGTMSAGKKCFNKLCSSKKIFKKLRSRVQQNKYRFLCKTCYELYTKNQFCEYCEQIYNYQEPDEEELKRWVGCDSCDRWNHIQCERKHRNQDFKVTKQKYQCLACSRKSKGLYQESGPKKKVEKEYEVYGRSARGKIEINKDQRVPIFHKKTDTYPNLEPFLQSYNFRLWLNQNLIRDDIDSLKALLRRPPLDEEPKKTKKVKQDW